MNDAPPQLRALQILVTALVAGVVSFAGIAMAVAPAGTAQGNLNQLRMVGWILLVACLGGALGIKFAMGASRRARRDNPYAYEPERSEGPGSIDRAARFFVMTVLGCALVEGVALYGVVIYMMSGQAVDLLGAGLAVLVMIGAFFPTRGRWDDYVGT